MLKQRIDSALVALLIAVLPIMLLTEIGRASAGYFALVIVCVTICFSRPGGFSATRADLKHYRGLSLALLFSVVAALIAIAYIGRLLGGELERALRSFIGTLAVLAACFSLIPQWLRQASWGMTAGVWAAAYYGVAWTWHATKRVDYFPEFNATTYGNLALLLTVLSTLSLGWRLTRFRRTEIAFKLLTIAAGLIALLATQTRGGWLAMPFFIVIGVVLFRRDFSLRKMILPAIVTLIAAGAILHYLKETEHPHLQHIHSISRIQKNEILWMDKFTIRNLELIGNGADRKGLLEIMDATKSPMGARMLKRWLIFPLQSPDQINARLDAVENLIQTKEQTSDISALIESCGDLERLSSKLASRKIQPRELLHLGKSLEAIEQIKTSLSSSSNTYLKQLSTQLAPCESAKESIFNTLFDQPPATIVKGGFISEGVSSELDELRNISSGGKEYLTQLQNKEAENTGISSLKIGFNNVYGYYLEVTHVHKSKVPSDWIRKQTLTTAERYITPELKVYEEKILGAEDKILALEHQLYQVLLDNTLAALNAIQLNGQLIATIDCLICFATIAVNNKYCKPVLTNATILDIKAGRHPVIEQNLSIDQEYIPNDVFLDPQSQQIIILTGPNMSGKSAVLRQTALITLMAHMGSYVPATAAQVPLTDKIFTRVGANDNLSAGESTFMVEMIETASILNNISQRSLILLDEIGRGTSTYDGISIAWSIVEFLNHAPEKPKTLFATHYHELNDLEAQLPNVHNYHVSHKEVGNKIIFLRKLAKGGSTHSFGIHVAKMAGMPNSLVHRANDILKEMELKNKGSQNLATPTAASSDTQFQLSIFDAHTETFESIRKELDSIDINNLTPVEALMKLQAIKQKLN